MLHEPCRTAAVGLLCMQLSNCAEPRHRTPPRAPSEAPSHARGESSDAAAALTPGPGSGLRCESSGKNAWETYGTDTLVKIDRTIGARALDPRNRAGLGDSSKVGSGNPPSTADDPATFEAKLAAWLVYAYGGPEKITYLDGKSYLGPQDMRTAHAGLQITQSQYDYFIRQIFVPALIENGVFAGGLRANDEMFPDDVHSCFLPLVTNPVFAASIVGQ